MCHLHGAGDETTEHVTPAVLHHDEASKGGGSVVGGDTETETENRHSKRVEEIKRGVTERMREGGREGGTERGGGVLFNTQHPNVVSPTKSSIVKAMEVIIRIKHEPRVVIIR